MRRAAASSVPRPSISASSGFHHALRHADGQTRIVKSAKPGQNISERCHKFAWGIVPRAPSMLRGRGELVKKKVLEFRQRGLNIEEASPNNDPVSRVNISDKY